MHAAEKPQKKIKINKQPDEDLSCFILLAATRYSTDGE
jgi:hypothetical protein